MNGIQSSLATHYVRSTLADRRVLLHGDRHSIIEVRNRLRSSQEHLKEPRDIEDCDWLISVFSRQLDALPTPVQPSDAPQRLSRKARNVARRHARVFKHLNTHAAFAD